MCDVDLRVCTGPGDVMKLMSLIYVHLNCICLVKWRVTRVILICLFAFRRSPVDLCHLLLKELVESQETLAISWISSGDGKQIDHKVVVSAPAYGIRT